MSNPFVLKEVEKIIASETAPQNTALAVAWIIAHFKGINIKILDSKETSSLCDYNILASAENSIQARAMVDEIVKTMRKLGLEVLSQEGLAQSEWVLLDLGEIIVHIFQEVCRDTYDLDTLWANQPQVKIPQEYYFGQAPEEVKSTATGEHYF